MGLSCEDAAVKPLILLEPGRHNFACFVVWRSSLSSSSIHEMGRFGLFLLEERGEGRILFRLSEVDLMG